MDTFTPEFIAEQREKAKQLESPIHGDKIHFRVEYYNGKAYLKAGMIVLASFTLGSHYIAEYLADVLNHYPNALEEIERLTKERDAFRVRCDHLEEARHIAEGVIARVINNVGADKLPADIVALLLLWRYCERKETRKNDNG